MISLCIVRRKETTLFWTQRFFRTMFILSGSFHSSIFFYFLGKCFKYLFKLRLVGIPIKSFNFFHSYTFLIIRFTTTHSFFRFYPLIQYTFLRFLFTCLSSLTSKNLLPCNQMALLLNRL